MIGISDWKVCNENKKEGITVWQRNSQLGNSVKAEGVINWPADLIFLILGDERYKKDYDENFDEGFLIEKFADQSYFTWFKLKKVAIVSPRDFILILHFNMMPDGTIYLLVFDAGNPELVVP